MRTLGNKEFKLSANSNVRDLGSNTILTIEQNGDLLFGKYEGGKVLKGNFLAKLTDQSTFEKFFHHYNDQGVLIYGKSQGKIEVLKDGRLRLREYWNANSYSGDAIYDELKISLEDDKVLEDYYYQLALNK